MELQFGVGSELLLRVAFPIHIAESVAGELHAAQIDELLQFVAKFLEIQAERGGHVVGRAGGVNLEEIGFALQAIDDRRLGRCRGRPAPK